MPCTDAFHPSLKEIPLALIDPSVKPGDLADHVLRCNLCGKEKLLAEAVKEAQAHVSAVRNTAFRLVVDSITPEGDPVYRIIEYGTDNGQPFCTSHPLVGGIPAGHVASCAGGWKWVDGQNCWQ